MGSHEVKLEVGARSDTGYVREENQDRMSGTAVPLGQLYIVADGMGGHKGGALAAQLTVEGLQQHIAEAPGNASVDGVIQTAFKKVNEAIYQKAHSGDPVTEGMGSTAVLLLISGRLARVAHVGDSRAYLYRNGRLRQLTKDHTVVQKMVEAGVLKPEEAAGHPNANILDRAVGNKPSVEVDISNELMLNDSDAILLCSDGLSGYVADTEIESVLRSQVTGQEIAERLVKLALQKGGKDNVSVQFVQYGTREKALPNQPRALEAAVPESATPSRRPLFHMAVTFVLGAALSVAAFYLLYSREKEITFRETESKLNTALENKTAELDEIKIQLQEVQGNLTSMDRTAKEARGREKQLEERLKKEQAAKGRLEEALKEAEKDRDNLKGLLETATADLTKTRGELKTAKKDRDNLEEQLTTTKEQLEIIRKKSQSLEKEISGLRPDATSESKETPKREKITE